MLLTDNYYYIFFALAVVPVGWIFKYAGFKPYWALLLAIPEAGLIACAMLLALRKWPRHKKEA